PSMAGPAKLLEEAQQEIMVWKDKAYRQAAEADNARRRAGQDVENARKFALQAFAKDLLPIADNLLRALDAPQGNEAALRQGVTMVAAALEQTFSRHGITKVKAEAGLPLNPEHHQAMSHVPSPHPLHTIAAELQGGYTLHDRLLRPAMVTVSNGEQHS
ncbi:MAG: nucleotide exchange factor GrpE, partial [Alphaproteobacteria bacterium]